MKNGVKCLYTNTDTLHNKLDEIKLFVDKEDIHFLAITETLSKSSIDCEPIFILPGFECISNNGGRGVALFVKDGTEFTRITDYDDIFSPSVVCHIKLPDVESFILAVIYRSPNSGELENENVYKFVSCICKNHARDKIVIAGDFNYPDIDWTNDICNKADDHIASKFLPCTQENYLNQIIESPTHFRGNQNPTLIDLILTNDVNFVQDLAFHPPFGKSHHVVLTFSIDLNPIYTEGDPILKYQMNKGDYVQMKTYFSKVDWNDVTSDNNALDDISERFVDVLNTARDQFVPKKFVRPNNTVRRTFTAPPTLLTALQLKR